MTRFKSSWVMSQLIVIRKRDEVTLKKKGSEAFSALSAWNTVHIKSESKLHSFIKPGDAPYSRRCVSGEWSQALAKKLKALESIFLSSFCLFATRIEVAIMKFDTPQQLALEICGVCIWNAANILLNFAVFCNGGGFRFCSVAAKLFASAAASETNAKKKWIGASLLGSLGGF